MRTLHLVSHTHWDREWYLTFQQFRLKLVHLIDGLLELLDADPDYQHFMLDGQTIVLDDYLFMRPERADAIREHVQSGRILVGPWHILPDEFLVSPEATIRNLLQGDRTARLFGPKMMVGYIPDPFGHIGQMPQILRGFGIETAAFRRGLSDEPCELWWESPDGSRVFAAYLRDGYDNAAWLPVPDGERFVSEVRRLRDSLAPHSAVPHLLLLHGTDHMEPPPDTAAAIAHANGRLDGDILVHSTLPDYLASVQSAIPSLQSPISTVIGELHSSKRHHLLPGVLSTRMWIKQRNHHCETLLEKWAEPFSVFASLMADDRRPTTEERAASTVLRHPSSVVRQAWRMLMECHPHDSICGCSIDQVHDEMRPRFDQVEQVGEEITGQSLETLAATINTEYATRDTPSAIGHPLREAAIVVFNPASGPRTDSVTLSLALPPASDDFEIIDEAGNDMPHQLLSTDSREMANMSFDREGLRGALGLVRDGRIAGMAVRDVGFRRDGDRLLIDLVLAESGEPNAEALQRGLAEIENALADEAVSAFAVHAHTAVTATVQFVARGVPSHGYRTFWLRSVTRHSSLVTRQLPPNAIENEFFLVEAAPADGTLTVTDKRTGAVYRGLNHFVDGGDCGDEYNYCPPAEDVLVHAQLQTIMAERGHSRQSLVVSLRMSVPGALREDRKARSAAKVPLAIVTRASLYPGVPRVDIETEVDNRARDHRLRVHFPATIVVDAADHDGHFEIVRRPIGAPGFDDAWVEHPRPEAPQRAFTNISDGNAGLMIANRGLPEVEARRAPDASTEIALTLLRCVGWLSRDDFPNRRGHAGPAIATPGAQMAGRWTFEYAIIPHGGRRGRDGILPYGEAYAFNAPMRAVSAAMGPGRIPGAASFVHVEPEAFVISAVKAADDGAGWIVRGYNIGGAAITVKLRPLIPFARAARVNLAEASQSALTPVDGYVVFPVRGHEVVTIKFDSARHDD
jgi:alpha-mannosidase